MKNPPGTSGKYNNTIWKMFRERALNCVHVDSSKSGDSGDRDRGQIHEARGERIKIRGKGGA